MPLNGSVRQEQLVGDLGVREPRSRPNRHLDLAGGEEVRIDTHAPQSRGVHTGQLVCQFGGLGKQCLRSHSVLCVSCSPGSVRKEFRGKQCASVREQFAGEFLNGVGLSQQLQRGSELARHSRCRCGERIG